MVGVIPSVFILFIIPDSTTATLERLNVFLRHIQPKIAPSDSTSTHPCVGLLQEMWPILTQIMQHYGDTLVSEVLCKCFKNAIISYDHHFLPLLLPFIEQATSTFVSTRQPCYPWAASHAIKRFAKTGGSEVIAAFVSMYQTMLQVTLQTLDSPERFDTFPDLVEDMFHLSSTFLRAVPDVFLALPPPVLAALLNMSKMGTECRHNDCIERALFWLRDLFQLKYATEPTLTSASIEQLTKLAQEFGPVLIMSILQGVTGTGASGLPFSGALYPAAAAALFYWTHAVGFDVALALVGAALGALSEERVSATDKAQIMELYQRYTCCGSTFSVCGASHHRTRSVARSRPRR